MRKMRTNNKKSSGIRIGCMALAMLACGTGAPSIQAADGTWNANAAGNWNTAGNWSPSAVPGGTGSTVNLTLDITAARTITIDTTSATVGILNIGDPATSFFGYTLAASGGASLILDNSGSDAQINNTTTTATDTISAPILLNDNLAIGNATSGALTISGTISSNTAGTKTITNGGSGSGAVTLSGVISNGSGTVAVAQNSSTSNLTLSGANTFTGGVSVSAGALSLNNALAAGANTNTITLGGGASNATLSIGGGAALSNYTLNVLSGAGTTSISLGSGATMTGSNAITLNGGQGLTASLANTAQMTKRIVESGGVSSVTLNANSAVFNTGTFGNTANAFSGGLTINGTGYLSFGTGGTGTWAGTGPLTINSAVNFNQLSASATVNSLSKLVLNSDFTVAGGSSSIGLNFSTAPVDLGATGSGDTRTINVSSILTLGGVVSDGTNGATKNLTKNGAGTLALNGANTYTGATTVNNGTLTVGTGGLLGAGDFNVNNTNTGAGNATAVTLSSDQAVKSLSGSIATPSSGTNTATITIANTKTLTMKQAANTTYAGVLAGAGSVALHSSSTGQLNLTGVNTYTGATTVGGGTLLVSGTGSINGTSGIAVNTGGTFKYSSSTALTKGVALNGGVFRYDSGSNYAGTLAYTSGRLGGTNWNGSLSGLTIGSGKILSPGNSPGNASTGTQIWTAGGSYEFEINDAVGTLGTNWDHISISGALDISGLSSGSPFTLLLTSLDGSNLAGLTQNFNSANSYSWEIASFGSLTGSFASNLFTVDASAFQNSYTGSFNVAQSGNTLVLNYTTVPEPSSLALLAIGLGTLWMLRRKNTRTI